MPRAAAERLEALPPSGSPSENDRIALLLARAIEDQGQTEAGAYIICRDRVRLSRAARPNADGLPCCWRTVAPAEALPLLEEVERLVKRLGRHERGEHAEMYDWGEPDSEGSARRSRLLRRVLAVLSQHSRRPGTAIP
jgi:hypothetical protein